MGFGHGFLRSWFYFKRMQTSVLRVCAALALAESSALVAQTPAVTSLSNRFTERLSPGSLVAVLGTNLTDTLGVQVGGRPAAVLTLVSPTQIAIQLPVEFPPGPTTLVVTTRSGTSSPFNITLDSYAPTLTGFGVGCKTGPEGVL